jgi:hypothetical protein
VCGGSFSPLPFRYSLQDLQSGRRQSDRTASQLDRAGRRSWIGRADAAGPGGPITLDSQGSLWAGAGRRQPKQLADWAEQVPARAVVAAVVGRELELRTSLILNA